MVNGLLTNLVHYYKCEDTTDSAGSATLTDTSITYSTGKNNNGRVQNASTDRSTATLTASMKSLSFWINMSDNTTNYFFKYSTGASDFQVYIEGASKINMFGPSGTKETSGTYSTGTWYHIVCVADGASSKLYINGSVAALGTDTFTGTSFGTSSVTWTIGNYNTNTLGMIGTMDEIGFWTRALSSDDVTALYNGGTGLFYDDFDDGSSGTAMQVNISDAWKSIAAMQINIGDSWKAVAGAKVNIGDAWKTIF